MDRTASTELQCLYKGALYLFTVRQSLSCNLERICMESWEKYSVSLHVQMELVQWLNFSLSYSVSLHVQM